LIKQRSTLLNLIKERRMSEENPALSIVNTWIKALTSPNEEAYQQIADDPNASLGNAALWVFLSGIAGGLITGIISFARTSIFGSTGMEGFGEYGEIFEGIPMFEPSIISVITCAPVSGIAALIMGLIGVGLIYAVSRALGGVGSFEKLFYTTAAFQVPLSVVISLIGAIPVVNCLVPLLGIYGLVLGVISNKVVMEYDWGKAMIASFLIPIIIGAIIFVCVFVVVGAALATVFGDIMDGLNVTP
jgi:hypothetical protein